MVKSAAGVRCVCVYGKVRCRGEVCVFVVKSAAGVRGEVCVCLCVCGKVRCRGEVCVCVFVVKSAAGVRCVCVCGKVRCRGEVCVCGKVRCRDSISPCVGLSVPRTYLRTRGAGPSGAEEPDPPGAEEPDPPGAEEPDPPGAEELDPQDQRSRTLHVRCVSSEAGQVALITAVQECSSRPVRVTEILYL
uniref:Uncharacterized protein n=1 Tax=Knipowitschia caucasica TaxID=637954 RepID=A0AAV2KMV0_KNICA